MEKDEILTKIEKYLDEKFGDDYIITEVSFEDDGIAIVGKVGTGESAYNIYYGFTEDEF